MKNSCWKKLYVAYRNIMSQKCINIISNTMTQSKKNCIERAC